MWDYCIGWSTLLVEFGRKCLSISMSSNMLLNVNYGLRSVMLLSVKCMFFFNKHFNYYYYK